MDKAPFEKASGFLKKVVKGDISDKRPTSPAPDYFCGDIDMRIARDGTWYYKGSPIKRQKLVKLFASILMRDDMGNFWLTTKVEKCRISVDDAPLLAVEMRSKGYKDKQQLIFRTNVDDVVIAGSENPIIVRVNPETSEPSPYISVRDGIEALITRAVFYDLVELGVEKNQEKTSVLGVWSGGIFFKLGDLG
mgnify:CR=1 FL=1